MLVRAVLFDLGNTLVAYYDGAEFSQVLRECLEQCAAVLGWSGAAASDDALFARAMALNAESPDCAVRPLDRRLSELFGLDGSVDASTLARLCDAFLTPILQRARLDPEALSVLQSLRERGIKVGIVSNSPWGSSATLWRQELTRHGLLERVDAAVFCGDVGWRKPNPAPFNRALELLQVSPHDALFVGDDARWDLVGAQNAGLRPVLLRSAIHRLSDVLSLVDSLMASDANARPFYGEYAWAYDLLIDRPVSKECSAIVAWLVERGVLPGAAVLDVGCGTGRYASELCRRGYLVTGIDRSPELISQAKQAAASLHRSVRFAIGDIVSLPADECDAILCRGVLNDLVDENVRESAFSAFGRTLRPKGVVILDVREWNATAQRKAREPLFRKTVATDRGTLSFTSHTELDSTNRRLVIAERHTLVHDGNERSSDYQFVMHCWTRDELETHLRRAGLSAIAYFGAYDAAILAGETDRLVVVAQREA